MTEQMQDHFERLDDVDEMLGKLDDFLVEQQGHIVYANKLRNARQLLTKTTGLLRRDYGNMARARDATIELLMHLRTYQSYREASVPACGYHLPPSEADTITQTIALLQGEEEDA